MLAEDDLPKTDVAPPADSELPEPISVDWQEFFGKLQTHFEDMAKIKGIKSIDLHVRLDDAVSARLLGPVRMEMVLALKTKVAIVERDGQRVLTASVPGVNLTVSHTPCPTKPSKFKPIWCGTQLVKNPSWLKPVKKVKNEQKEEGKI